MPELNENLIISCARNEGLTVDEIKAIARTAPKRYYVWVIPKRSGGERLVCHPARELKSIQEYILRFVLHNLPVHSCATAYVKGSSIKRNAQAHLGSRVIFKIDFSDFFNSITVENWKIYAGDHYRQRSEEEIEFLSRVLFWGSGSYNPKCLAIGAPSSPLLSNALMHEVDDYLSRYAAYQCLTYTRYADDITFSSASFLDQASVLSEVKSAIARARYTHMKINTSKIVLASNKNLRRVTGLVLTPNHKISLGRDRKRLISAMTNRFRNKKLEVEQWPRLGGLLAFAQDVEPSFLMSLREKYGVETIDWLLKWGTQYANAVQDNGGG